MFEKITLYDIRTTAADVRKMRDGRYETILTVRRKYYADGKGKETEAPLTEMMGFDLFAGKPGRSLFEAQHVLALRSVAIRGRVQQIRFVTTAKPSFAGADPNDVLLDRTSDDNVIATTG